MSETDSTDARLADAAPEADADQEAAPPDEAAADLPDDTPEGFEPV